MAKTHLSLSHDASLLNAPTGFTVTVRDLRPYTGAGWIVALCGDMQTMPGLGKTPGGVLHRRRRAGQHRRPVLSVASGAYAPRPTEAQSSHGAVPRPPAADARRGRAQGGPHGHRDAVGLRAPDALRPARRLPARDDEEGARALRRRRAALVRPRRHERRPGSTSTASRSGTSGPTRRATSGRSTATSGARGRRRTGATSTSSRR